MIFPCVITIKEYNGFIRNISRHFHKLRKNRNCYNFSVCKQAHCNYTHISSSSGMTQFWTFYFCFEITNVKIVLLNDVQETCRSAATFTKGRVSKSMKR